MDLQIPTTLDALNIQGCTFAITGQAPITISDDSKFVGTSFSIDPQ